jgi:hypothetical protein
MGKFSVKFSAVSDCKSIVKTSDVPDGKSVVLPQPLNSINHLVLKPDINYKQLGTVSRTNYIKKDIMIFHQNIYLFIYLFFTIHRSKLGYNNPKHTEIVIFLNTSDKI